MIRNPVNIDGVTVLQPEYRGDARGSFARLFCDQALADLLDGRQIVQINHSITHNVGALRGLHYQEPPHAEMKFVKCLRGKVFDVAVDLRKESSTYLQWFACELSADERQIMVIPEGCAHGFQVLEPDSELLYLHTSHYAPEHEAGLRYDDPELGIQWPLDITEVSERDRSHNFIGPDFSGL